MTIYAKLLKKYNELSKPAKASIWFVSCYIIQRGLQFIGMPIYTRIMSAEEYGIYSVFLSWFNLICVFSSLSVYNGTFNKAMVKYESDRDAYISSVQWLTFCVGAIFAGLLIAFSDKIERLTGYTFKFVILMSVYILLFPSFQYWSQKQRFMFEYKKLVFVTLINSIFSLGMGVIFVTFSSEKGYALVLATVLVQLIINGILFILLFKKGKVVYNHDYWKWTLLTAFPLIPHYLSEIMLGHSDRLMINQMCGASQAGIYNIVYQISMVMTIIRTGINGSFTPWLYYSIKSRKYEDIKKVTKIITLIMSLMTLIFMLIGPEILMIVAPPSYYEALNGIPAIMIGSFFIFVYVLFLNVEIYYEQNHFVSVASIIAAIVNVLLNYVCITKFGYIAAAYTTMISYALMAVMHYCFMVRILKKCSEAGKIFDIKFIIICLGVLLISGVVLLKIYEISFVRWLIILSLVVVIYLQRKKIIPIISMLNRRN